MARSTQITQKGFHVLARTWQQLDAVSFNVFVWVLLLLYLLPVAYMVVSAFKSTEQLSDSHAP